MMSTLYAALDDDALLVSIIAALPQPADRLAAPAGDADVSTLRRALEDAPGPVSAFVLAVGLGRTGPAVADTDWRRQVLTPLRRAFGLLTGAGRRFRREGRGTIVVLAPSAAVGPAEIATPQLVLLRSIVGMAEALRAELQDTMVRVSLVFYDSADDRHEGLVERLAAALSAQPMYSLSDDITSERIQGYFAPILQAIDQTSAGPPLPDIGPMAAVYDLAAIGAPSS